jgi:hypothetical protein
MNEALLDPVQLDRTIERAQSAWRLWRRGLFRDPAARADEDPFAPSALRSVATKTAYDGLEKHPLRKDVERWVAFLLRARLTTEIDVELARALHESIAVAPFEAKRRVSFHEALRAALEEKSAGRAAAWLTALGECAPPIATVVRERAVRRDEVWRRLGGEGDPSFIFAPLQKTEALARAILEGTDDLARAAIADACKRAGEGRPSPAFTLGLALGREANAGWPARLGLRWLDDLFGAHVRGLTLDVAPLPKALGGASFARALEAFGFALRTAKLETTLPFTTRCEPFFVDAHRLGATFGALTVSTSFHRRSLGAGAATAQDQARVFARTALLSLRWRALRALAALRRDEVIDRWEELGERLLGAPLARSLAGAWPAPEDDEAARFFGAVTAFTLTRELTERFDEDWFKNPRAFESLRMRAVLPADATVGDEVDPAVLAGELATTFERLCG